MSSTNDLTEQLESIYYTTLYFILIYVPCPKQSLLQILTEILEGLSAFQQKAEVLPWSLNSKKQKKGP